MLHVTVASEIIADLQAAYTVTDLTVTDLSSFSLLCFSPSLSLSLSLFPLLVWVDSYFDCRLAVSDNKGRGWLVMMESTFHEF